ncbi:glycosyltransferase family 9 protein [Teichococcus oryzae]|uniref:Glycosyltransferase family 9 protein n=1 Tax=Teichococcus oryzae TaxID=1608942 RepID=A0A5B2TGU5_9PROT|nr:glycosyltransferase family 9 protein [Pseudoroseomonas oryzae]KAA2213313.1 glycosyltransferase family 9 protein [Pseudoroseomonas oryzae]
MNAGAGRILVIKLAALGDFIQAFGPFAAIREHHPGAEITLLTTPPFAGLARRSPWFDRVWTDGRPEWRDLGAVARLALKLRRGRFTRVYDLQTSGRSSRYRWFTGARPDWSGIARGASHPHDNPARDQMHTLDRQQDQLRRAGIAHFPQPDMRWLEGDLSGLGLPGRFGLLIPGASPHRPGKRWPVEHFAALAAALPVPVAVLGGPGERALAEAIRRAAPATIDLTGRTDLLQIGALARRADFAVGNDTGPTHLVAAAGCPTVALFGAESDPALSAPRGPAVAVLRHRPLAGLDRAAVRAALADLAMRAPRDAGPAA